MKMCKGRQCRLASTVAFIVMLATIFDFWQDYRILSARTATAETASVSQPMSSELTSKENGLESPKFRMLLGIFSTESTKERHRRTLIKNTYLSFPKFMYRYNVTTLPTKYTHVCSLREYWHGNMTRRNDCQLLYTWVVGAAKKSDPKATTEYLTLNQEQEDRPMTISKPSSSDPDTTYLNIIENMNEGKSQTWFKYASSEIPEDFQIDLIAKVDTDCLVYPTILLSEIERIRKEMNLSLPLHRIYGGSRQRGTDLSYMQGGFYFLSRDVARYITSDQCQRDQIIEEYKPQYNNKRAEDVEISRFVRTFPGQVREIVLERETAYYHESKLKRADVFRDNWKQYIATIVARDRIVKIQMKTNTTCPPRAVLDQGRDLISEDLTRVRRQYEVLRQQLPCD